MNEEMVHRTLAAFNTGNATEFGGLFNEDGILTEFPDKVAETRPNGYDTA